MAKVFTITEGLENMGALKTGGQGSVYKGRRIGEIITAVKLLPTPMHTVNETDKHFRDFQSEVEKLKKVNEVPNPNVVKILSSGFTESGSFPFIEMEFIEGPDLEELLKPPHDPIFTIKEAIKLAEQLSNALAHCHKVAVKHGDIKSNNVKLNVHTGNYVLLDFGLAIMSDEQRRTSLRQAGAIEFMAPEQNEGEMLFETDVYSFGIILYEVLCSTVPFPLKDKGETARNMVRLAHMETPPPDLLGLRKNAMPAAWENAKKEHEMQVPEWLVSLVYKCIEKNPENRFKNGMELHEFIVLNSTLAVKKGELNEEQLTRLMEEKRQLQFDKDALQKTIQTYQAKEKESSRLQNDLLQKDRELEALRQRVSGLKVERAPSDKGVSKAAFFALLILTAGISAFAAYALFFKKEQKPYTAKVPSYTRSDTFVTNNLPQQSDIKRDTPKAVMPQPRQVKDTQLNTEASTISDRPERTDKDSASPPSALQVPANPHDVGHYRVAASKTYFHNAPDASTQRKGYLNQWNKSVLTALDDENGFVYIIYTNEAGQTSKGWIRKADLEIVDD